MVSIQNPNLCDRLIRIIETHAEELTQRTIEKLRTSPQTTSYHSLSHQDLHSRVYAVYHDLGRWLWEKSSDSVRAWYNELGEYRCKEGVPLAEVLWALVLTKERLLDYLAAYGFADSAMELYQQQEFERLVSHFFDRAVCFTAEGYEHRAHIQEQIAAATGAHSGVL